MSQNTDVTVRHASPEDAGLLAECYIRMTRKWDDKKYVRPIPTTALNDNPALGQNYGWEK